MLIKLIENQIDKYKNVIDETIKKSMPHCEERIKTDLYKELLLGTAQCWIYYNKENKFEGVLITQIRNDIAVGKKTFTLICIHAPEGTKNESFIDGWPTLQAYGKANNCEIFDFYTDNPEAIKYARLFSVVWETQYFQIDINK